MTFRVEIEQETDGRWIAEVIELSGVMAYGATREEAVSKVQALAGCCEPEQAQGKRQFTEDVP